jgi:hypothetical protein
MKARFNIFVNRYNIQVNLYISKFKTQKYWRIRAISVLHFPAVVQFKNRSFMAGEEVFCRGLFELRTGLNKFIIANEIFGLHQPDQSFAFTYFLNHLYDNFMDLVTNNFRRVNVRALYDGQKNEHTRASRVSSVKKTKSHMYSCHIVNNRCL